MEGNGIKKPIINSEGRGTLLLVSSILLVINLLLFLTPAFGWWSFIVLAVSLFIILFLLFFFRNPERRFPSDDTEKVVVSPADGTVVAIEEVDEPDYFKDKAG